MGFRWCTTALEALVASPRWRLGVPPGGIGAQARTTAAQVALTRTLKSAGRRGRPTRYQDSGGAYVLQGMIMELFGLYATYSRLLIVYLLRLRGSVGVWLLDSLVGTCPVMVTLSHHVVYVLFR